MEGLDSRLQRAQLRVGTAPVWLIGRKVVVSPPPHWVLPGQFAVGHPPVATDLDLSQRP